MANKIGIAVEVDDGGATKKIRGISSAFDKLGGPGSGASLFGNVGAKAVAVGFNLIGDAAGGAAGFLRDAFDAAVEDQASQALLGAALMANIPGWKYSTDAVNAYVDAQIEHGFADDEVRASLGQLVGITHDATKAQDLNTIAQDLARAKGIDLATATDIVGKAALGNGKALKSLGIDTHGAKDAMGLLKAITDNTKGSMDAYDGTMAGKVNISQKKFNEAMEKIGYTIMPVVSDLMQKFSDDWLPALGRGWDKVKIAIKPVLDLIGSVIGALGSAIQGVKDFLAWAGKIKIGNLPNYGPYANHAEGGWVGLHGPEMAIVGERGPEYIVPNHALGGMGGGGGDGHGHAIYMDGKKVADAVSERQFYAQRRAAAATTRV
jgi:hypothetical protein